MSVEDQTNENPDPQPIRDASLHVDESKLSEDEVDFARMMGFGDEGSEPPAESDETASVGGGAEPSASLSDDIPAVETAEARDEADADEEATPEPGSASSMDSESSSTQTGSETDDPDPQDDFNPDEAASVEAAPAEITEENVDEPDDEPEGLDDACQEDDFGATDDDAPVRAFDTIEPRPSNVGIQDRVQDCADQIAAGDAVSPAAEALIDATATATDSMDVAAPNDGIAAAEAEWMERLRVLEGDLADRDARLATYEASPPAPTADHEKQLEALASELDVVGQERDQLIHDAANQAGALARSESRIEQLELSLRTARKALTPLPEGERALRAEVLGLRTRLEEAASTQNALRADLDQYATELAIERARDEDRQHEIELGRNECAELQGHLEQREAEREEALERSRDALVRATRLQSENTELRSAQDALQETLAARDLEIAAKAEQLSVTRQGLEARDGQLSETNDRVAEERLRADRFERELEQATREVEQLRARLARRDERILSLTETLTRVGEAIGQRIVPSSPGASVPSDTPVAAKQTAGTDESGDHASPDADQD